MHVPMFDLKVENDSYRKELLAATDTVLKHGCFMLGPEVQEFEARVAEYVGMKYCMSVDSGSSALYLALRSLGIGAGDEVITTPLTWIITLHAISACGAIPICVDVNDDCNISPEAIKQAVTPRTKAIVPMHYSGLMCDMEQICQIAVNHDLFVVEDAAQAFGAEIDGRKAGSFSHVGAFSMNSMKPLSSCGEAGAVVTNDAKVYEILKSLRHAGTKSDPKKIITNEGDYISLNHKMDIMQAAMLLVSLNHFKEKQDRIETIAKKYSENMSEVVRCPQVPQGSKHAYFSYPIITNRRDDLKTYLADREIESKIFHIPLASHSAVYAKLPKNDVSNAEKIRDTVLNLPCHEKLTDDQVDFIIYTIKDFFKS